jgi:hypothetical protein
MRPAAGSAPRFGIKLSDPVFAACSLRQRAWRQVLAVHPDYLAGAFQEWLQ